VCSSDLTKPGVGYPKKWENQTLHRGGWEVKNGKLRLVAGEKAYKLLNIFHNPDLPPIDEYYEPWTYDYERLISSPQSHHQPIARAKSLLTGEWLDVSWGPSWEDDLAGVNTTGAEDVNFGGLDHKTRLRGVGVHNPGRTDEIGQFADPC